jgi:FAD/FMN-containing dehydrogenase
MSLERALVAAVGASHVITDREICRSYERDWTGRFGARARCVVRPGTTEETAEVLATCAAGGVSVVPQGGNTGLVGAGVPRGGEVLLSMRRLDDLGEVDAAGQVEAGAGATLAALQRRASAAGLDAGLDFAARDSATLGGIVSCNAGGARALRHGTARARTIGLQAVFPGGLVVTRLSGLLKDNAGLDLPSVMIGSEGTLGVLTRVRWRLSPRMPARVVALVPVASIAEAVALLAGLRAHAPSLDACEFFLDDGLELVLSHRGESSPLPVRTPVYVLAELAGRDDPTDELAAALSAAGLAPDDVLVAHDAPARERLWALREGHTEAINAEGVPHKADVGVPLAALADFVDEVPAVVAEAAPGARVILFGHLADGNVHVNVLGAAPDDRAEDAVLGLALRCGGTISAEHGVGVAKARWLERGRGAVEVRAMRAVKRALDPGWIMNPGAVLER